MTWPLQGCNSKVRLSLYIFHYFRLFSYQWCITFTYDHSWFLIIVSSLPLSYLLSNSKRKNYYSIWKLTKIFPCFVTGRLLQPWCPFIKQLRWDYFYFLIWIAFEGACNDDLINDKHMSERNEDNPLIVSEIKFHRNNL